MPVGGERERFGPAGDVLSGVVVPWVRTTEVRRCAVVGYWGFFLVFLVGVCERGGGWLSFHVFDSFVNGQKGVEERG